MGIKRYHLLINGHVQGVGYRVSAREKALQLGLTGWVRNCADGCVEMLIEGSNDALEQMLEWAARGPRFANVTDVDVTEQTSIGDLTPFDIR